MPDDNNELGGIGLAVSRHKAAHKAAHKATQASGKKWVAGVKTDSTHPPEGLFTKSASTIARVLASKKVSPKGPASGLRMPTYFINRAGKGLSTSWRAALERAKVLLSDRVHRESHP